MIMLKNCLLLFINISRSESDGNSRFHPFEPLHLIHLDFLFFRKIDKSVEQFLNLDNSFAS
ncbi:hypothetical protein BpHYR1_017655 [Brachionus plicatilis]|uniref:Uncharacterized protein n=1 Tax=Brachionus plicatilis TaxID=10195 RepID=A0A3M7P739_BRAPC|nr:hypothetical protein BpHYR1_017655 [Brachionus plicatilis]